jgi:hypothetical protein
MKFRHIFENIAVLALVILSLLATPAATAQTILSNEALVNGTLVVNTQSATAGCGKAGCRAKTPMFAAIQVACPAPIGQTCTFHISLDAKVSLSTDGRLFTSSWSMVPHQRFAPTDRYGVYLFQENVVGIKGLSIRQSDPASVVATVTNSSSNNHSITLNTLDIGCIDSFNISGCATTARESTMRVDVFEP